MLEQGFQQEHMLQPALLLGKGITEIGPTELNHPPLYYTLIAVPLRLLRYADVRTQLYAARAVSLLLEPRVTLRQEPDLSLDRTLVAAWRDTVRRLVWR